ncbi:hypothetical protein SAMN05216325_1445 [Nitrosomonas marina]|uniref:TPR repeat-containing protein n=1 Tax=Nitrosomonas marina TaxID=917 RepID=A0A1H8IXG0_9PROT|nr:hypothetical protein SAMN05216325_1445 [Nitrosomonas marina]
MLVAAFVFGCASNQLKTDEASFNKGLAALEHGDFAVASGIYSELSKNGYPAAMNNLGVSLLMVDREDEALYWFNMASRYGDKNAKETLEKMGRPAPSSDLVGQHPTQIQEAKMRQFFVTTLTGLAIGVTAYLIVDSVNNQYKVAPASSSRQTSGSSFSGLASSQSMSLKGFGSNRNLNLEDDDYPYSSFSGMLYKYDLSKPIDQIKYDLDISSQLIDSINPSYKIDMDRDFGQFGGGAKW